MLLALTPDSTSATTALARSRSASADRTLMEAIHSGDVGLARQIYAGLLPAVHATLARVLGPSCREREALTARSVERIIAAVSAHPSPGVCKLEVWATAITARVALDMLRSRTRSRAIEVSWGDTMTHVSGDDAGSAAPGSVVDRLRWLLGELPLQQAEAVLMCDVMGLVQTEVAVVLGVSLEHLRRLLRAGHERLTRSLA